MIFRYPGGKYKVRRRIIDKFYSVYDEYREPFVGGGSVFFSVPTNKKRWINDIDEDLISVYIALRDDAKSFIEKCKSIKPEKNGEELTSTKPGGKKIYNARLKKTFEDLLQSNDKALKYFFINRTVWAGRVNYELPSRLYFSNPQGWNIVKTNKLEKAASILEGTRITSTSYEELLSEDGQNVLIYIDPPYVINTDLPSSSQLYRYNFTLEQHEKLSEDIKRCKHKVIISYDDNVFIRKLYQNYNIYEDKWTYCGTSNQIKRKGNEILITNYEC